MWNPHRPGVHPQIDYINTMQKQNKKFQIPTKKITPNCRTSICSYNYYSVAFIYLPIWLHQALVVAHGLSCLMAWDLSSRTRDRTHATCTEGGFQSTGPQ